MEQCNPIYTFKQTQNYKIQLEFCSGWVFLHCYVYSWSKGVRKELCELSDNLIAWLLRIGATTIGMYTKNTKFVEVVMPYMYNIGNVKGFEVYLWA